MKKAFALFLFLAVAETASACMYAWQKRQLLLGMKQDSLVIAQLVLYRSERDESRLRWQGISELIVVSQTNSARLISRDTIRIECDSFMWSGECGGYTQQIGSLLKKQLAVAQKLKGFSRAKLETGVFAGMQKGCSIVTLSADTNNMRLECVLKSSGKTYFLDPAADSLSYFYRTIYTAEFSDSLPAAEKRAALIGALDNTVMSSARIYSIGNRKVLFLHLTTVNYPGEEAPLPGRETAFPQKLPAAIPNSAFEEPVEWHGNGSDFFIFL
jgi:hypothetical protein